MKTSATIILALLDRGFEISDELLAAISTEVDAALWDAYHQGRAGVHMATNIHEAFGVQEPDKEPSP
jgi:hypothetical protein